MMIAREDVDGHGAGELQRYLYGGIWSWDLHGSATGL